MDPDATLTRLLDALRERDRDTAFSAAFDLCLWIKRGGCLPDDPRPPDLMARLKASFEAAEPHDPPP